MATTIYLVPIQKLKDKTVINNNVDDSLLSSSIQEAQEIELQQILGTRLYKYILELVGNGLIDTVGYEKYKFLLDEYCTKVVIYAAALRALPSIHFKVMNKGVNNQNSDNSQPTSLQELEFVMDRVRNDVEFFSQRLSNYLLEHRIDYPEYMGNYKIDEMQPNIQNYHSNLVLDDCECPCIRSYGYNWRTITL